MLHNPLSSSSHFTTAITVAALLALSSASASDNKPSAAEKEAVLEKAVKNSKDKLDDKYGAIPLNCGALKNAVGPYDYRVAVSDPGSKESRTLSNVHLNHWGKRVQAFTKPNYMGDITYILRAYPNHHPALYATLRVSFMDEPVRTYQPQFGDPWPMSFTCYIDRAIRFQPKDGVVWMIWGIERYKKKDYKGAVEKYSKALEYGVESSELQFNIGLAYLKLENLTKASEHAKIAYDMGYPLPGLKRKLQKLGAW